MLTKYNPLLENDTNETIIKTKLCNIDYDHPTYKNMDPIALDLLKNLLEKDQNTRFST